MKDRSQERGPLCRGVADLKSSSRNRQASSPRLRELAAFLKDMEDRGLVIRKEYDLPLPDTLLIRSEGVPWGLPADGFRQPSV